MPVQPLFPGFGALEDVTLDNQTSMVIARYINDCRLLLAVIVATGGLQTTGCVSSITHGAVVAELGRVRGELAVVEQQLVEQAAQKQAERDHSHTCELRLASAEERSQDLSLRLRTLTDEARRLRGEKGELTNERQELGKELEELRRMRSNLYPDYGDSEVLAP